MSFRRRHHPTNLIRVSHPR